jgi:hypothetical protein
MNTSPLSSVTPRTSRQAVKPPSDGQRHFDPAVDRCIHRHPPGPVEEKDPALTKVQREADELGREHILNNETISALHDITNSGHSSRLLGRIAARMKAYDDARLGRSSANSKLPYTPNKLVQFTRKSHFNAENVKADNKFFRDVLAAVNEVPDSGYRDKILKILAPVQKRPGSPIPDRLNQTAPAS